jgi:hypothetical protein
LRSEIGIGHVQRGAGVLPKAGSEHELEFVTGRIVVDFSRVLALLQVAVALRVEGKDVLLLVPRTISAVDQGVLFLDDEDIDDKVNEAGRPKAGEKLKDASRHGAMTRIMRDKAPSPGTRTHRSKAVWTWTTSAWQDILSARIRRWRLQVKCLSHPEARADPGPTLA